MLVKDQEDSKRVYDEEEENEEHDKRASVEILRSDLSSYRKLVDEFGINSAGGQDKAFIATENATNEFGSINPSQANKQGSQIMSIPEFSAGTSGNH